MSGARSRRTGAVNERHVARWLADKSHLQWQRSRGGEEQPFGDVVLTLPTTMEPWRSLFVEVKAHRSVKAHHLLDPTKQVIDWWDKAYEQAHAVGKIPTLWVRVLNVGWFVLFVKPMDEVFDKPKASFSNRDWLGVFLP